MHKWNQGGEWGISGGAGHAAAASDDEVCFWHMLPPPSESIFLSRVEDSSK